MKKYFKYILLIVLLITAIGVKADVISIDDIPVRTYVIGNQMFTRDTNYIYDGELTTQLIMYASKTIDSSDLDDFIIYYKNPRGNWVNALTGESVYMYEYIDIQKENLYPYIVPNESLSAPILSYNKNCDEYMSCEISFNIDYYNYYETDNIHFWEVNYWDEEESDYRYIDSVYEGNLNRDSLSYKEYCPNGYCDKVGKLTIKDTLDFGQTREYVARVCDGEYNCSDWSIPVEITAEPLARTQKYGSVGGTDFEVIRITNFLGIPSEIEPGVNLFIYNVFGKVEKNTTPHIYNGYTETVDSPSYYGAFEVVPSIELRKNVDLSDTTSTYPRIGIINDDTENSEDINWTTYHDAIAGHQVYVTDNNTLVFYKDLDEESCYLLIEWYEGNIQLFNMYNSTEATYNITYDLDGGVNNADNPDSYVTTEYTVLYSPTKYGYGFIGWTGSNGEIPDVDTAIYSGTRGDLHYTANWIELPAAPTLSAGTGVIGPFANLSIGVEGAYEYIDETTTYDIDFWELYEVEDNGELAYVDDRIGYEGAITVYAEPGETRKFVAVACKYDYDYGLLYSEQSNIYTLTYTIAAPTLSSGAGATGPFANLSIGAEGAYEYIDENTTYDIDGWELYEVADSGAITYIDGKTGFEGAIAVYAEPGETRKFVAIAYKNNSSGVKVYSEQSNIYTLTYTIATPTLSTGAGASDYANLSISVEGAYEYIDENTTYDIDGWELYEVIGNTKTLVGSKTIYNEAFTMTLDEPEQIREFVARVYKYNSNSEPIYSEYSNVFELS